MLEPAKSATLPNVYNTQICADDELVWNNSE
jgi:hypothetical protein